MSIFLRDMRLVWNDVDPAPTPLVKLAMEELRIKDLGEAAVMLGVDRVALESALSRVGKLIKRGKWRFDPDQPV